MSYCYEEAYRHEILEKKPYGNLLWKLHSLSSIRRFINAVFKLKEQAQPGSDLDRLLSYQMQLGQYRRDKVYQWYRGAEGWITDNLLGKHDGQDYAADIIRQLEHPTVVDFKPLVDIASSLSSGKPASKERTT